MSRRKRRQLYKRRSFLIAFTLVALLIASAWAILSNRQPSVNQGETLTAAIVDQLSASYPNSTFRFALSSMFNEKGWSFWYYAGGAFSDNVDFYRSLPQHMLKIIILRAHTAMDLQTGTLALFTSEQWDDTKASTTYLADAMNDRIARVRVTVNSTAYFGMTPNFIRAMNGDFQNATVVMMGCDGLTNTKMAEAFIERGAMAYIGWTGPVSADHTDTATQQLMKHLISENKTIATAITETLNEVGKDPAYGSTMSYYPALAGECKP